MNRRVKLLILLLCMLCAFSAFALTAFADETAVGSAPTSDIFPEPRSEIPVSFIIMKGANCRTEYTEGEYFSADGFYGRLTYSDGSSVLYYPQDLVFLQTGPLTTDTSYITFVASGLTCNVAITVDPAPTPTNYVAGIEVTSTKTEYLALENIDLSSLAVNIIYSDGTLEPLDPSLCSFYPAIETPLSSYNNSIYVTYTVNGIAYSDTIDIDVSPVLSVDITGIDDVKFYESTEPTVPGGITVTAYYDENKTVSRVITDFDISYNSDLIMADENGKTIISILIDTATFDIEIDVLPIVGYNITGFNSTYYYGDTLSFADVRVYAAYSDGTTANITSQVEFSGPEIIEAGSKITAFHNGFDLKDFLKISLPEGKLVIIQNPAKTKYEIGEIFDSTGLLVGIDYSDGHRNFLASTDYTLTVSDPLTAADKFATVSYLNIEEKIYISVGDEAYITSLKIIGSPDVWTYFEGNCLNTSGLIIEATFSDGTTTVVDASQLTFAPALNEPLTPDITTVTISVNNGTDKYCETTLPITVNKKVPTALAPISLPNKLEYAEGEIFDPDGLQLMLLFNDNSSIVLSSFSFSPELGSTIILRSNATEKFIVYAVYEYEGTEFTYPIEITVNPAKTENLLVSRTPTKTVYEIGEEFDPTGIELILIYKDRTLPSPKVPNGYFTYSPSVITAATKEITISFRGLTVTIPISVKGAESSDTTTAPIDPPLTTEPVGPDTSEPDVTTEDPNTTTDTEVTTDGSSVTTAPDDTPGSTLVTSTPEEVTTEGDTTTDNSSGGEKDDHSSMLYLWIIIIVIIIVALVALIIYYKKNFT